MKYYFKNIKDYLKEIIIGICIAIAACFVLWLIIPQKTDYEEKYNNLKEDYDLLEDKYDGLKNNYNELKDDYSFLENYSNDLAGFLEELERDYPEIYDKIGAYQ